MEQIGLRFNVFQAKIIMKKTILFFLFIGISYFSKAQLSASGFGAQTYDSPPAPPYNIDPAMVGLPFVSIDAGTNKYSSILSPNFAFGKIFRSNNYWYIGAYLQMTPVQYQIVARTKVPRPTVNPPCVDVWENVGYNQSNGVITPLGTYFTGTLSGPTCDGSALGTTMLPNITTLPQLTNAGIQAIVSPTAGSMVYDTDNNCISVYNGVSWNCLVQVNTIVISNSGFTLNGFYNYIIYTGAAGTMTIPAASTCPNREYFITNYGTGNLTLSNSYTYGNALTTAIIAPNTTVHLIAIGGIWYKI
jgi:hypothetical protein